jgi:hypothetical protein
MGNNMDSTVAAVERRVTSKETQLDGLQNKFGLEEEQQFDLHAELRKLGRMQEEIARLEKACQDVREMIASERKKTSELIMLNQAKEIAKLKAELQMLRQDPAAEGKKSGEKAAEAKLAQAPEQLSFYFYHRPPLSPLIQNKKLHHLKNKQSNVMLYVMCLITCIAFMMKPHIASRRTTERHAIVDGESLKDTSCTCIVTNKGVVASASAGIFLGPPATADDDQTVSRYEQLKDAAAGGGIVGGTLLLDSTPRTFDNLFSDADNDLPVSLKVLSTGDDDFNRSLCFVVPDINNKTVNEVEAAASNIITDTAETISTDLDGGDEEGGDVVHCTKIVFRWRFIKEEEKEKRKVGEAAVDILGGINYSEANIICTSNRTQRATCRMNVVAASAVGEIRASYDSAKVVVKKSPFYHNLDESGQILRFEVHSLVVNVSWRQKEVPFLKFSLLESCVHVL